MSECKHNNRCRYMTGFQCEDCDTFFELSSPTYRSDELLSSIWMVLHNINAARGQAGESLYPAVELMLDKIGIGVKHGNYEELISEAEFVMKAHGVNSESANVELTG